MENKNDNWLYPNKEDEKVSVDLKTEDPAPEFNLDFEFIHATEADKNASENEKEYVATRSKQALEFINKTIRAYSTYGDRGFMYEVNARSIDSAKKISSIILQVLSEHGFNVSIDSCGYICISW